MTRLEEHDLKVAKVKAENRQKRIDLLLSILAENKQSILIAEYRERAKKI